MSKSNKLVFFGSGPVGKGTLEGLQKDNFNIEAIITKPLPEKHRGSMPVLEYAKVNNIPVFTPQNKQELTELFDRHKFNSPIGVVVDYGIIIDRQVIDSFPLGIINSHFSLLPEWRGADPITFALLSGQPKTGVSLMLIEPSLDTGDLLAQAEYDIEPDEDIISLTNTLISLSNQTLSEVLPKYIDGQIVPFKQDPDQKPTYSRRLTKTDGLVDIKKPAEILEREVRAHLGWPKSRVNVFDKQIIILSARVAKDIDDGDLVIKCNPGYLEITKLIAPSGRTMNGADFLRGYKS